MSNYNTIMIVDEFKLKEDKKEEFMKVIKGFAGVECVELKDNKVHLSHIGTGYIYNVSTFDEEEYAYTAYNIAIKNGLKDITEVIQYYMEDEETVTMKDIGHCRARSAHGYSAKITKESIEERRLHQ